MILLSARAGEEARVEGVQAGADDYLVKPFSARELLARVESQIKLARFRRKANEALRYHAHQFETLINQAPLGVYLVDADFRIREVNPIALPLFGKIEGGVLGRDFDEIVHLLWEKEYADEVVRIFRHTIETGESYATPERAEFRIDRGDTEYYEWRLDRIVLPDGRFGLVCYLRNVSEQVKARLERESLLESERAARAAADRATRLKDEFLAVVSHELRSPLNAIAGWTHLLKKSASDPRVLQCVEVIERNTKLQAQVIADLLDMSRITSGKLRLNVTRLDMKAVVEAAIRSILPSAESKGVRIETRIGPLGGAEIFGDSSRLEQVLNNLLSNAVKFTPKDGRVEVELTREDTLLELAVRDTGEGIEPEFMPHLFDRFRQADGSAARKHGGLGLGLALVRQLTELHGGSVEARSEGKGRGATFLVRLPIAIEGVETGSGPGAASSVAWDLSGLSVLLVDDDPDAAEMMKRMLEECRATVITALGADEALARLGDRTVDVIVSDIGMPVRDGYDFIRELRSRGITTPAVALTAFARLEDRARALQAGYRAHVAKPVKTAELLAALTALRSSEAVRRLREGRGKPEEGSSHQGV